MDRGQHMGTLTWFCCSLLLVQRLECIMLDGQRSNTPTAHKRNLKHMLKQATNKGENNWRRRFFDQT